MVTAVFSPGMCPFICSSTTEGTGKIGDNDISEILFDITGVYVSDKSVLSPIIWATRLLEGMVMFAVNSPSNRATDDLCPIMCSTNLAKAIAVTGCGTSLMGVLENTFPEDYMTTRMVCPVITPQCSYSLCNFTIYLAAVHDELGPL